MLTGGKSDGKRKRRVDIIRLFDANQFEIQLQGQIFDFRWQNISLSRISR